MEEQSGIVLTVDGDKASVRASRHSHCESCGSCPGSDAMTIVALNVPGAKPGQRVAFIAYETSMIKAAFVTFVLPLITTTLGLLGAYWLTQTTRFLPLAAGAAVGAAGGIVYVLYFDRRLRGGRGSMPEIVRIID